jgi:hypothetical protein
MAVDFVQRKSNAGLTVVLYRGEDMALLAFDIDESLRTPDFVGFGVQYRVGNNPNVRQVFNFLTFKKLRDANEAAKKAAHTDGQKDAARLQQLKTLESMRSPIQRFRWAHVPSVPINDKVTYRVSALFWKGEDQPPEARATVEATIDIGSKTRDNFLNVGFTRGFASSQAYARRFENNPDVLQKRGKHEIDFDTSPFEGNDQPYPWLGFEARKLQFNFLDECATDPTVELDVFAYDLSNPEIVRRLEAFKKRLRIVIDNSGTHGRPKSEEAHAEKRLVKTSGRANVKRHKFGKLQHNKVFIAKRAGKAFAVMTGSTNFALRGLYIQNNNVLVFRDDDIAAKYARAFDKAFPKPDKFKSDEISTKWFEKDMAGMGTYRFAFSPHSKAEISLEPLATAIQEAESSVLYAIAFRGAQTGPAADALDAIDGDAIHVMGVADKPGGSKKKKGAKKKKSAKSKKKKQSQDIIVRLPGRGGVALSPAALKDKLPEPFRSEWPGGSGMRMHHKFVICDFNGAKPVVFTGSSNLASGGETGNGDNLIEIRDPKVVVAYAVQAVSIFDHYAFRVRMKDAKKKAERMDLAEPPSDGERPWWNSSFESGNEKDRDRKLFSVAPFEH